MTDSQIQSFVRDLYIRQYGQEPTLEQEREFARAELQPMLAYMFQQCIHTYNPTPQDLGYTNSPFEEAAE